ncbi:hypothetical protein ACFFS2_10095 [Streptomyces aurantiacus]|uniref:DUF1430 domain-containing protein n=1 Tax=Streptomyces aurantiacus TaxID=47760 RepID=A0A7G1NPW9_9ACTN|nr:hypothetical protein [Streptomyces aurantiacus]BCL25263.1 hypothetical protein GCM10017557_01220 [Streptomyces aurantiacus]
MLHQGIKYVHAAVLAFSAVLAFLFVRGLDEDWVLGHSALVWVSESDHSSSGEQVVRAIESFAAKHGVTVARELPDLRDPHQHRHLYLAAGNPGSDAASWLAKGYPAFGRDYHTDVHPIAEFGQRDPRGFYYVFGSPGAGDALLAMFADLGLRGQVNHPLSVSELTPVYSDGALFWSFLVVALAAVTLTGASVLLSAKTYGALRLQGKSFAELLLRDLRQLGRFWAIAAGTVTAAALLFLGSYNGLAWLGLYASVTAGIAGLLILVVLAAHAAALALTCRIEVLRALKGELPARLATVCAYLVRAPALLLALSIATTVVLAAQDVLARQDSRDAYAKAGDATAILLNGSLGPETAEMEVQVGQWLRKADAHGQIIVAGRRELQDIAPGSNLPQGEILIVNETFLAEQPILDPMGRRYGPAPRDEKARGAGPVRIIVPESLNRYASTVTAEIPGLLSPHDPERIRPTDMKTFRARSGQRVFGYDPGSHTRSTGANPDQDRSMVRNPVLVVVPNGSKYLTDNAYTAFATQGGVVFSDPDDVLDGVKAHKLQTYVKAMSPIGQNAALELRRVVNDFRMQLFNLGMAVAVLLITGVGVCIVYSRKNAQAIFVKHISGWRFAAAHRSVLAGEALLAILLAVWVPFDVWHENQELERYTARGIPAPSSPVQITTLDISLTFGLIAVEVSAVLLALAVFHRRIVKERATEA